MKKLLVIVGLLFCSSLFVSCNGNNYEVPEQFKVRFCDESGQIIRAIIKNRGDTVSFSYEKPSTETISYTFLGWSKTIGGDVIELPPVTENITYYAIIKEEPIPTNQFLITFCDDEGITIKTESYKKGDKPSFTPSKSPSSEFSYYFLGWSITLGGEILEELPIAQENATYYAAFEARPMKNKAKVIVLSGQSNMEGHDSPFSSLSSSIRSYYGKDTNNIKIFYNCQFSGNNSNSKFVNVDFGQGRDKSLFGPEVGLAKFLATNDPETDYYFVKSAKGSCYLETNNDIDINFSYAKNGVAYQQLERDVSKAFELLEENDVEFELSGLIWMQGEADACNSLYASHYEANEKALLKRFTEKFTNYIPGEGLIFIDSGVSTLGWPSVSGANKVNQAKKNICNSNSLYAYCSESETLGKINEFHYTAQSYLQLGEKYGEQYYHIESNKMEKISVPTKMKLDEDQYVYWDSSNDFFIKPEFVGGSEPYSIELKASTDYVSVDEKGKITLIKKPPQNPSSNSGRACNLNVKGIISSEHFSKEFNLHLYGEPISYFQGSIDFYVSNLKSKKIQKGKTLWIGDSFFDSRNLWDSFYTSVGPANEHFNAGISGSSIESWLGMVEKLVYPYAPINIVINCGTNDFWDLRRDGKTVFNSLVTLVETIHQRLPDAKIYYYSVINRNGPMPNLSMSETISTLRTYNKNVSDYAAKLDYLFFLNTFNNFCNSDGTLIYSKTKDGIHPANDQYPYIVKCAKDAGLNVSIK